jgi:hypothetical protein
MYTFGFLWRWEAGAWQLETPPTCEPITRIFGVQGVLWATSWKEIWQHTPLGWVRHDAPVRLFALHGWPAGPGESPQFIAGGGRALFHLQGDRITTETGLPESVSAVWGLHLDDVFAVGWNGMIMRKTNGQWAPEESGVADRLTGVWGQADEIVIVGENGIVLTSSGDGRWIQQTQDATRRLNFAGIWGDGAGVFYAVTDSGQILARRAGTWTIEQSVGRQLLGIQGCAERGEVWSMGLQGNLWRSVGDGRWTDCSGARTNSLHTVHREGDRLWVGGDWFFEITDQRPKIEPG